MSSSKKTSRNARAKVAPTSRRKSPGAALRTPTPLTDDDRVAVRTAFQHFARLAASAEGVGRGTGQGDVAEEARLGDDERTLQDCVALLLDHLERQHAHQAKFASTRLAELVAGVYERFQSDDDATTESQEHDLEAVLKSAGIAFDAAAAEAMVVEASWIFEMGGAKQAAKEAVGAWIGKTGKTVANWGAEDPFGQRLLRGAFGSTCTPAAAATYARIVVDWLAPAGHPLSRYQTNARAVASMWTGMMARFLERGPGDLIEALTDASSSDRARAMLTEVGVNPADPGLRVLESRRGIMTKGELRARANELRALFADMYALADGQEGAVRRLLGIPRVG